MVLIDFLFRKSTTQTVTNGSTPATNGNSKATENKGYSQSAKDIFDTNRKFASEIEFNQTDIKVHPEGAFGDVFLCGECQFRSADFDSFIQHKKQECQSAPEIRKLIL